MRLFSVGISVIDAHVSNIGSLALAIYLEPLNLISAITMLFRGSFEVRFTQTVLDRQPVL